MSSYKVRDRIKSVLLVFSIFLLTFIVYNHRFDIKFECHVYGSDKKLFDGDFLHPTYAYLKSEKLIGIEFTSNPECGRITKNYLLDENEILRKIIYETDFFTKHCDSSSLYIIENNQNEIHVTNKNGMEINNEEFKKMMSSFNIKEFKIEIQKWKQ